MEYVVLLEYAYSFMQQHTSRTWHTIHSMYTVLRTSLASMHTMHSTNRVWILQLVVCILASMHIYYYAYERTSTRQVYSILCILDKEVINSMYSSQSMHTTRVYIICQYAYIYNQISCTYFRVLQYERIASTLEYECILASRL